jgi:hypothetical protein
MPYSPAKVLPIAPGKFLCDQKSYVTLSGVTAALAFSKLSASFGADHVPDGKSKVLSSTVIVLGQAVATNLRTVGSQ